MKRFHWNSYGSIPGKGLHKGAKKFEYYQYKYKYALKLDIRHFYANIGKDILRKELEKFIDDEWFINLVMKCFKHHKKGLPLGFYLSQWLSNVLLTELDYEIEATGCPHVRYVDDLVIFSNNKSRLFGLSRYIHSYLGKELRLKLKHNSKWIINNKEPVSFLGFVFTNTQIRLRGHIKKHILHITNRIKCCKQQNKPIWLKDARRLLSAVGWIEASSSYSLFEAHIKPYISLGNLKRIVSKIERIDDYDRMERRTIVPRTRVA